MTATTAAKTENVDDADLAERRNKKLARADAWSRRMPLLPALVFMIIVTQVPFVATIVVSFMNWNAYYPKDRGFAGLDNFTKVLTDSNARSAILTTVVLTVLVVLITLVLGLCLALLLDRKFRGRGFARTLLITPFLIVPVASALLWKHALYNAQFGLFNGVLHGVFGDGGPQPDWVSNHPLASIVTSLVWQWTPFMMLIMLAGLQGRPLDVVEAAQIDGATSWQIFTKMTLPHMRRYIELAGLLGAIYIVQTFDAVFTITSGGLGTANLPYYIYETFYSAHDYGTASAAGVLVVLGTIVIATFALRTVLSVLKEQS